MKKLNKVNENQLWQLIGLLSLSKSHYKQIMYLEEAIADTLGLEYKETDVDFVSDMIWNGENDAQKLLRNLDIKMP